jgi:transcriptional regulator with XRE-family HTH domain
MSAREAFGPNLRRLRMQRGISLDFIAKETKVGVAIWSGLEKNDLSRWPTGIYARAYVRSYAQLIGADPEATVDEFCRLFPNGDRRAERLIRGQAEIIGHPLAWQEQVPGDGDRRDAGSPSQPSKAPATGFRRWLESLWGRGALARTPR